MAHSPEAIRKYQEKLRHQRNQLERTTLSAVEQGRTVTAEETQDTADQAVSSYQKEMLFRQGTEGHVQLSLVCGALDRIHEGTFGECLHCGKTIGAKRLEALPWTPYCIECQERVESGELEDPVRAA